MKLWFMSRVIFSAMVAVGAGSVAIGQGPVRDPKDIEPLKIHRTVQPLFPVTMSRRMIDTGEARVLVMIDKQGRLADWMITGYSHAPFAKEALDVIQKWKFEPATYKGEPIEARAELRFNFKTEGIIRMVPADMVVESRVREMGSRKGFWQRYCESTDLDRIPETIVEVSPMPPDRLGAVASEGKVLVDYYVDPEGRVRMPIILSSDDDAFSQSVLLAMSEWKYEAPRRENVPVMTRMWREFVFRPIRTASK